MQIALPKPAATHYKSVLQILAVSFLAAAVFALSWVSQPEGGLDYRNDIAPAARSPWSAPWLEGLPLPPWAAVLIHPLTLLPDRAGSAMTMVLLVVATSLFLRRYNAPWWAVFPVVISSPGLYELGNGQSEWLVLLGLSIPATWGLPVYILKPQDAVGVAIPHLRKYGLSYLLPGAAVFSLSLLIWGNWPLAIYNQYGRVLTGSWWNISIFPYGLPLGLYLLYRAWRDGDDLSGIMASPLLFPYVNACSLVVTLAAAFAKWGRGPWAWVVWVIIGVIANSAG